MYHLSHIILNKSFGEVNLPQITLFHLHLLEVMNSQMPRKKVTFFVKNLTKDSLPIKDPWIQVNQLIIGNITDGPAGLTKGIPKSVDLYVYRIHTSTDINAIENLLNPYFSKILCESMQSRYPNLYSSYKLKIYQEKMPINNVIYLRKLSQYQT